MGVWMSPEDQKAMVRKYLVDIEPGQFWEMMKECSPRTVAWVEREERKAAKVGARAAARAAAKDDRPVQPKQEARTKRSTKSPAPARRSATQ